MELTELFYAPQWMNPAIFTIPRTKFAHIVSNNLLGSVIKMSLFTQNHFK